MKVLIADDDKVTQELLRRTLIHAGFEVIIANDGERAFEIISAGECRLIISDWEMPKVSGPDLCRRLRGLDGPGYIYIIMLTARRGTSNVIEALSAGADEFLSKPVDPNELLVRVRTGSRIISLESRELAIFALAKLAESRDNETGAHLERVREYSRTLAHALSTHEHYQAVVTQDYVRNIYITSPLHDIGKVGIPDSILLKPARLSDREFEIMKRHTVIGAETLDALVKQNPEVEFLKMSRDIALTHHEQWSGGGYPHSIKGDDIPLCGRIVALADVYDALTSRRVYKAAFPHEVARGIIAEGAGKHFDPELAQIFLNCEQQLEEIRHRFGDVSLAAAA